MFILSSVIIIYFIHFNKINNVYPFIITINICIQLPRSLHSINKYLNVHELERGQFNQINIITTIFTITINDWLLYANK